MDISTASTTHPRHDHAIHNRNVCKFLAAHSDYNDWVITTAFYSALHWMEYHLFPMTISEGGIAKSIVDIDGYAAWMDQTFGRQGKHQIRRSLVRQNCAAVAAKYCSLHDTCMAARYRDYQVGQKLATKALKNLEAIEEFCDRPKS